jgi:hypothetical protein
VGKQVDDTTTTANSAILLPVQDGPIPDCRKKHIWFVQVQLKVDFASLATLDPLGITVLRIEYYIELPQGHPDMQNSSGATYRLTTFLGPDNICHMPVDSFSCNILGVTLQDGPLN